MRDNTPFGFDQPEDSPGFLLWQTTVSWQRLIKKALDKFEISHAQFVIMAITLWFQNKKYDVTQTLIIKQSKLDKMTVSKSLKKLVAVGYVKREEHKEDTRAKSVQLTKKGKELTLKLVPIVEGIDEQFFGTIKSSHQKSLIQILSLLVSDTESQV